MTKLIDDNTLKDMLTGINKEDLWKINHMAWEQISIDFPEKDEERIGTARLLDALEIQIGNDQRVRTSVLKRAEYYGFIQFCLYIVFIYSMIRVFTTRRKTPLVKWGMQAMLALGFFGTVYGISKSMGGIVANFGSTDRMADAMSGIAAAFGTTKLGLAFNILVSLTYVLMNKVIRADQKYSNPDQENTDE